MDMDVLTSFLFLLLSSFEVIRKSDRIAETRANAVKVIIGVSGESERLTYKAPKPETKHAANYSHPIAVAANKVGNSRVCAIYMI